MKYLEMKKRAFMSIVNAVKGFVRKVSGVPPITLPDCVDNDSIISYSIEGNSVQNGEPTPENPVEIESVGEKTKNLLPYKNVIFGKVTIDLNKAIYAKADKYVLSFESFENCTTWRLLVRLWDKDKNRVVPTNGAGITDFFNLIKNDGSGTGMYYNSSANGFTFGSNWSANQKNLQLYFDFFDDYYVQFCVWLGDVTSESSINGLQFNLGEEAQPYEPYGYKIPIKMSGKNLFDIAYFMSDEGRSGVGKNTMYIDSEDSLKVCLPWSSGNAYYAIGTKRYELNTAHMYSLTTENKGTLLVRYLDENGENVSETVGLGTYNSFYGARIRSAFVDERGSVSIPVAEGAKYFQIGFASTGGTGTVTKYYNIQLVQPVPTQFSIPLEEGTTAKKYEPYVEPITTNIYLDEPLKQGEVIKYPKDGIPRLPTTKGTTIYSVETAVQPSNMSVEYYSTRKGE